MKIKVGHYVYMEDVVEIDDKWRRLIEIGVKDLLEKSDVELDYYEENIGSFISEMNKAIAGYDDVVRVKDMVNRTVWAE